MEGITEESIKKIQINEKALHRKAIIDLIFQRNGHKCFCGEKTNVRIFSKEGLLDLSFQSSINFNNPENNVLLCSSCLGTLAGRLKAQQDNLIEYSQNEMSKYLDQLIENPNSWDKIDSLSNLDLKMIKMYSSAAENAKKNTLTNMNTQFLSMIITRHRSQEAITLEYVEDAWVRIWKNAGLYSDDFDYEFIFYGRFPKLVKGIRLFREKIKVCTYCTKETSYEFYDKSKQKWLPLCLPDMWEQVKKLYEDLEFFRLTEDDLDKIKLDFFNCPIKPENLPIARGIHEKVKAK